MKIIEKIEIVLLSENSVHFTTNEVLVMDDGVERRIENGDDAMPRVYVNSVQGRKDVAKDLPENISDAVLTMWGDKPTAIDMPFDGGTGKEVKRKLDDDDEQ